MKSLRALAYPLWLLGCVAAALWRHELVLCTAGGVMALGVRIASERAWRNAAGQLALANLLTMLRLGLVANLPLLFDVLPRFGFIAVVVAMLVLDGVDGWVARRRDEVSAFGASLDMETDALCVMVLACLLYERAGVGPWVLAAGIWRYAFAAAVALVPSLGDAPRSQLYRWMFCFLMVSFAGAFVPWPALTRAFAAIGTTLVSLSFAHALVRSSALARPAIESARP